MLKFKYLTNDKGEVIGRGEDLVPMGGQKVLTEAEVSKIARDNPDDFTELHVWGPTVDGRAEMIAPVPEEFMTSKEKAHMKKLKKK